MKILTQSPAALLSPRCALPILARFSSSSSRGSMHAVAVARAMLWGHSCCMDFAGVGDHSGALPKLASVAGAPLAHPELCYCLLVCDYTWPLSPELFMAHWESFHWLQWASNQYSSFLASLFWGSLPRAFWKRNLLGTDLNATVRCVQEIIFSQQPQCSLRAILPYLWTPFPLQPLPGGLVL